MEASLTERLSTETEAHHRSVERTRFLRALAAGGVPRSSYCRYLRNLHPLYREMEGILRSRDGDSPLSLVWEPALARTGALERDLEVLHGPGWRRGLALVPTGAAYAERIREIRAAEPMRLAAHCYLRYLGDLSGGRMLRPVVADALGLRGEEGLAFYAYPDLDDPDAARVRYRDRFDGLPPSREVADAIVDEAARGYDLHRRMFEELQEGGT